MPELISGKHNLKVTSQRGSVRSRLVWVTGEAARLCYCWEPGDQPLVIGQVAAPEPEIPIATRWTEARIDHTHFACTEARSSRASFSVRYRHDR